MIGAMPAVAVRHERRKGQDKRNKRPSQLYIGGHWLPPTSPSPTPSPNGHPHHTDDSLDPLPEYYLCGKVSALQIIVGLILVGAIILIVGLVQLVPNAADADHRYILLGSGAALLILGFLLIGVRCFCVHCRPIAIERHPPVSVCRTTVAAKAEVSDEDNQLCIANSIDGATEMDGKADLSHQMASPSEMDSLIGKGKVNSGAI